ncbi:hypothetical protein KUTeg_014321 [Tegillarca granosa]|uniref:Tetratricopeptide repeat protein 27 n=1 Tax=Tegillarca granosa TaxID=220873 RepID=A0ABQ9F0P2_TEGGR|nr:hypothetical protein KUTeg_014321 [Tegillarca granosa]
MCHAAIFDVLKRTLKMSSEQHIRNLEMGILSSTLTVDIRESEFLKLLSTGVIEQSLLHPVSRSILTENEGDKQSLAEIIQHNVEKFMSNEENTVREAELLGIAVVCLQRFIQYNWLGPAGDVQKDEHLPDVFKSEEKFKQLHDRMFEELSMDGEPVYGLCHCLYYLYISRYILLEYRQYLQNLQTADWWLLRCLSIQQNILDDKSPTLKETIMELIDKLSVKEPLMTDDKNRDLIIQFNLEAGYLCFVYYEYKKANYHFNAAKKMSGLTLELSGAMGKRTRFQEENKAQLVLMVSRETTPTTETTTEVSSIEENKKNLPKNVSLDDDTLYNEILFQDGDKQFATNLSSTEQALVLGTMENYRRSRAHHDTITEEEIMAYITELVNQVKRSEPSAGHRLYLFYATKIPPVWMIQRQLADLLISLGAVGSALEIYERLELWEDAIKCYQRLGKLEKYEKCMECFEKSLIANGLQVPVWFTYGCAAMAAEKFNVAVKAFKRCTSIDTDVGTDCGEFREVIQAYHRLMDLKEKWVDVETTSDADVWRLYAQLTDIDSGDKPEKQEKVLQYLQKSHRCVMQDPKWEQDTSRCKEVSSHSVELADSMYPWLLYKNQIFI